MHDQQDLAGFSADRLREEICTLAGQIAAATCRWLLLLAEWDRRGAWSDGETKTCADWLSWRCSIMPATAREQLRVARRLRELPRIAAAFASGSLSYSKVRAITRVAEPATEEQLVMLAEHASGAVLERLVRGYRRAASACLQTSNDAHERRHLSWEWAEDGSLRFRGRLPADDGALLLAALSRAEQELPEGEQNEDSATRFRNRRADALVSVARSAIGASPGNRRSDGDPCEVIVHVDAATLPADDVIDRTDLEDGPSLAPETVRRLACDASVVRIVERDGRPLTVGRRARTIPAALRRALRARDRACRFPGCNHDRFLHAHHVRHWARGGATDISNLVMLCSHHHRLVHEGGYTVELCDARPGAGIRDRHPPRRRGRRRAKTDLLGPALRFRRPDGTMIPDQGGPGPLRGPSVPERVQRWAPAIDASSCQARSAGGRCDPGIAVSGLLERTRLGRDPG